MSLFALESLTANPGSAGITAYTVPTGETLYLSHAELSVVGIAAANISQMYLEAGGVTYLRSTLAALIVADFDPPIVLGAGSALIYVIAYTGGLTGYMICDLVGYLQ